MAAHLEGKGVGVIDMAGLAQKGGAVYSHMRIAERAGGHPRHPRRGRRRRSRARRRHRGGRQQEGAGGGQARRAPRWWSTPPRFLPGDFTRNADFSLPTERLKRAIAAAAGARAARHFIDATRLATALLGDSHRRQHVPARLRLSARRAAAVGGGDRAGDRAQRRGGGDEHGGLPLGPPRRARSGRGRGAGAARAEARERRTAGCRNRFDEMVARRVAFLTAYQDAAYAARYRALVEQAQGRRSRAGAGQDAASPKRSRAICSS